jgi:hypothetical protein
MGPAEFSDVCPVGHILNGYIGIKMVNKRPYHRFGHRMVAESYRMREPFKEHAYISKHGSRMD